MAEPLLTIDRLSVYYGKVQAVRDVTLTIDDGEIVSIIGANGAGKSSLLKAILGRAEKTATILAFEGTDIRNRSTPHIIASGIAMVPEGRRLFPSLTVEENLDIGLAVGRPGGPALADIYALFPALKEKRRQKAGELSGGQQQMVAIGRALLSHPKLLLCDEISLGLAPVVIEQIYVALPRIRESGVSIILVEQDIGRSLAIADRFYCLLEGEVSLAGQPQNVTRTEVMRSYFGEDRS